MKKEQQYCGQDATEMQERMRKYFCRQEYEKGFWRGFCLGAGGLIIQMIIRSYL